MKTTFLNFYTRKSKIISKILLLQIKHWNFAYLCLWNMLIYICVCVCNLRYVCTWIGKLRIVNLKISIFIYIHVKSYFGSTYIYTYATIFQIYFVRPNINRQFYFGLNIQLFRYITIIYYNKIERPAMIMLNFSNAFDNTGYNHVNRTLDSLSLPSNLWKFICTSVSKALFNN